MKKVLSVILIAVIALGSCSKQSDLFAPVALTTVSAPSPAIIVEILPVIESPYFTTPGAGTVLPTGSIVRIKALYTLLGGEKINGVILSLKDGNTEILNKPCVTLSSGLTDPVITMGKDIIQGFTDNWFKIDFRVDPSWVNKTLTIITIVNGENTSGSATLSKAFTVGS